MRYLLCFPHAHDTSLAFNRHPVSEANIVKKKVYKATLLALSDKTAEK